MSHHESEFKKASGLLKGVRLSDAEKTAMLKGIYSEGDIPNVTMPSPFTFTAFFQSHRYVSTFAAVVLLIGGTAHASFDSLPGDPLYGIKVNVIEPAVLTVRLEETAKNEYRVAILQERVEEIQKLKAEGRLSFDVETISSMATKENLTQIESSAMFTATGTNLRVSGYVETYNSLVEETHRLKTIIQVGPKNDGKKNDEKDGAKNEDGSKSSTITAKERTDDVTGTLTDTLDATTEVTDEIAEDILDPVIPKVKNTEL